MKHDGSYTIGYYYNGRPFHPFGSYNVLEKYKNGKLISKSVFVGEFYQYDINDSSAILKIEVFLWDTSQLIRKDKYKVDAHILRLIQQDKRMSSEEFDKATSNPCHVY